MSVEAKRLMVQGAADTYPVIIQPGALIDDLPQFVSERQFSRAAVITNTTLAPLYGAALAGRLPGGFLIVVPDGEQYKNLDTISQMYTDLLTGGADRSSVVIGLGGGVIGDMAGFAAATFMRGITFIQAPTSLLAMVDSSIGAKVGVDLPQGKNLVGAFKDPLAVFMDTDVLQTLPDVERRCGLAEAVKSALIGDPPLLDHLREHGPQPIQEIIERAATVKINLVGQDRLENGVRTYLNLGHTFGHALEHLSGYEWKHGQAVAVGMVAAAYLGQQLEYNSPALVQQIESTLAKLGLPIRYMGYNPDDLWDAMLHDKKWRDGTATFVLLEDVGKPRIERHVPREAAIRALKEVQK